MDRSAIIQKPARVETSDARAAPGCNARRAMSFAGTAASVPVERRVDASVSITPHTAREGRRARNGLILRVERQRAVIWHWLLALVQ